MIRPVLALVAMVFSVLGAHSAAGDPPSPPGWIADARTGCKVWNAGPQPGESVQWSGNCVAGLATGTGTLHWFKDGKPGGRYEGQYRAGKQNGRGTFYFASGNRYEGDWRDGKPDGQGTKTNTDGQVYSGTWVNGCFRDGNLRSAVNVPPEVCGFW